MDVQNISGTDIVSNKISANTEISNENLKTREEPSPEEGKVVEENKGNNIDTYA